MTRAATPPTTASVAGPAQSPARRGDAIDHWLGMFTRFLCLPHEQSRAIEDELDSHMRERVRDLMLEGLSEDEGMRRAIDELGEAAELAAHFRAAHQPNRRLAMSIAAIGVAAGAAVVSIVALTQTQQPAPTSSAPVPAAAAGTADPIKADHAGLHYQIDVDSVKQAGGVPVLRDIPLISRFYVTSEPKGEGGQATPPAKINGNMEAPTVRSLAETLVTGTGKRLSLNAGDIDTTKTLKPVELVDADVATVLRVINDRAELSGPRRLDVRYRGEVVEVAQVGFFDKQETCLIAYDLTAALNCNAQTEDLIETVTQFVEADGWRENGGETARLKVVGTKMFVEAPPRYHERVSWILTQFSARNEAGLNSPFGGYAAALRSDLDLQRAAFLRREIAWTKVKLGESLSAEEMTWMNDQRAVHAIDEPSAKEEARKQLAALVKELSTLSTTPTAAASPLGVTSGAAEEKASQVKVSGPFGR